MAREPRCQTVDFNWNCFLNDGDVRAMSPRALGLYVRLCGAAREAEKVGWIKGDEQTMRRLSGASDEEWRECGTTVLARFHSVDNGYLHSRMRRDYDAECARMQMYSDRARKGAEATNRKRWSSNDVVACSDQEASLKHRTPSLLHSFTPKDKDLEPLFPAGNETTTGTESKAEAAPAEKPTALREKAEEEFRVLWRVYPHHGRRSKKQPSLKRWLALKPRPLFSAVLSGLQACKDSPDWQKNGGEFVPGLQVWIGQWGWDSAAGTDGKVPVVPSEPFIPTIVGGRSVMARFVDGKVEVQQGGR